MAQASTDALNSISNQLLDFIWSSNPVEATTIGVHDYDQTFGDLSLEVLKYRSRRFRQFTSDLISKVELCDLDPHELMQYELCMTLSGRGAIRADCERAWEQDPSWYAQLAVWGCASICLRDFAPIEERLSLMLSRMREIPQLFVQARRNISKPHNLFVSTANEILNNGVSFFEEVVPGFAFTVPELQEDLLNAAGNAVEALRLFSDWLRRHVSPLEDQSYAIGRDSYQQLLYSEHRLTCTTSELLALAYRSLEDAEEEIRDLAFQIDPNVTWKELVEGLDYDCPTMDMLLDTYRFATDSAKHFVIDHQLVTIPESSSLDVSWTPEAARSAIPYAACFPPVPFGQDKRGELWISPPSYTAPDWVQRAQLQGHCIHQIPIIALHEGYPGHYLQIATQIGTTSPLAKQMCSSIFTEGWASYCEYMMGEQGFYISPEVRLSCLRNMLSEAARVIVDVGVHAEGMSLDDAANFLVDRACFQMANAVAEVRRCVQQGAQSITNLAGRMLILDIRHRMKLTLGHDFDLKSFHDKLLSYGAIPPSIIAKDML
jgi:hypothetical protein